MKIEPNTFEYEFLLTLVIIIVIVKGIFSLYLLKKLFEKKEKEGKFQVDFLFCAFIFMVSLFISRILLIYYDFFLTYLDPSLFHLKPNVYIWKIANFPATLSISLMLYTLDKKVINFKLKGVLAYITLGVGFFQLLYPVNSAEDFQFIQNVGFIGIMVSLVLPFFFIYIAKISPRGSDLQKSSIALAIGIIVYAIGGNFVSETFLAPARDLYGDGVIITMWTLSLIIKLSGLGLLTYGARKFKV